MLLSIVTLNYKKPHLTVNCMKSLFEQYGEEFEKGEIELLIVDNDSGDDSVDVLHKEIKEKRYKHVTLIPNSKNAGFGAGCNLGAASAKGNYFLFLNNDTVVKDRGFLSMLAYMKDHADVAILGGQLHNFDMSLQSSAGSFYTPLRTLFLLAGMQKLGMVDENPRKISQVDWVKGALLMIQSEVFKKLEGFDENIFMYMEDMELCYRAKLAGYKTYFYSDVMVVHSDQGSSNRTFAIVNIYKNLLYFYKKHRSHKEYLFVKTMMRAKAGMLIGVGKLTGNNYLEETYKQAIKF